LAGHQEKENVFQDLGLECVHTQEEESLKAEDKKEEKGLLYDW